MLCAEMLLTGAELAYWRANNPSRIAAAEPPVRIGIIASVNALRACAPLWRELENGRETSTALFQSYDWCSTWLLHALRSGHSCEPFIVAAHCGCRLVLLWPMMVTHIAGLRVLRWLSDPWAQYGDVLAAQGHDASDLMARALEMIGHNKVADAIWLRHVREDATAHPFLRTSFEHTGHSNGAPFMDLTKFPTESEYLARYSKQQRKRRRQIQRTLENIGNLRFESHEQGSALAKGIAEAIRQKRIWLSDRGLISKPIFSNWLESFLLGLSTDTAGRLNVVCSILKAGDRPVSYEIGLRYRERHCCFITAHDNALTDDSPSRLHMDRAQRSALKEGYKAFDLMVPLSRHKQSWSSGHVPVSDYWLPLSARGRIAGSVILKALRPLARAAYNRTPPILRRAACALIG